ncbi:uncharacterized protein LOC107223825 isoform X2 [Neodiprion lecontei]|uniref:Uncharacterized protein LOC107223825 isoform X2 n=1 Tax=Neodiprion lecontei TaxID=441921 RepID=A0ABM3G668_NEOLC|nr:uncharacterized protein LOC107223825 isoform X2 [Neodiprion lecontei]
MPRSCVVSKCKTGYKSLKVKRSVFKAPSNVELFDKWKAVLPEGVRLTATKFVCERHFKEEDIVRRYVRFDQNGRKIADVPFKCPRLADQAVPSIFTPDDETAQSFSSVTNYSESSDSIEKNDSQTFKAMEASNVTHEEVKFAEEKPLPQFSQTEIENVRTSPASKSQTGNYLTVLLKNEMSICTAEDSELVAVNQAKISEEPKTSVHLFDALTSKINQGEDISKANENDFSIPTSWTVINQLSPNKQCVTITHTRYMKKNGVHHPIFDKYVTIDIDNRIRYFISGRVVEAQEAGLQETLLNKIELTNILNKFGNINLCGGLGNVDTQYLELNNEFRDYFGDLHSDNCSLISKMKRCRSCIKLRKIAFQRKSRYNNDQPIRRMRKAMNPIDQRLLLASQKKLKRQKRKLKRIMAERESLKNSLAEKTQELTKINNEPFDEKCSKLNIPAAQRITLNEIIAAASTTKSNGRRYSNEWIMQCLLLNIKSPSLYEYLRVNNILPLPCSTTIRRYFSLANKKCNFDQNFTEVLRRKFDKLKQKGLKLDGLILLNDLETKNPMDISAESLAYVSVSDFRNDVLKSQSVNDQPTHGLVLMLQSLTDRQTHLVTVFKDENPIRGEQISKLIIEAIACLENCGATIHGVIADDKTMNKKIWSSLGVEGSINGIKTWFTHPVDESRKVFAFSNALHLIRCIRDQLYDNKRLRINSRSNYIEWKYIQALFILDSDEARARVCPEITQNHVKLDSTLRMCDCLATQVFSNSVANGLKFYLDRNCDSLIGCEETIAFCKRMNDMFDALKCNAANQGLTPDSANLKVLDDCLKWLNTWEFAQFNGEITADEFLNTETAHGLRVSLTSTIELCKYLTGRLEFKCQFAGEAS